MVYPLYVELSGFTSRVKFICTLDKVVHVAGMDRNLMITSKSTKAWVSLSTTTSRGLRESYLLNERDPNA